MKLKLKLEIFFQAKLQKLFYFEGYQSNEEDIQKHIFPPKENNFHNIYPIAIKPPQRHYKIIFVKPPSTTPAPSVSETENEKTIIYVLVKNTDEIPQIETSTPEPTKISKPEVYFLQYRNMKEEKCEDFHKCNKDNDKKHGSEVNIEHRKTEYFRNDNDSSNIEFRASLPEELSDWKPIN